MQSSTLNNTLNNENGTMDSLNKALVTSSSIKHLFLVGGFAESSILQESIRKEFGRVMKVVIPQVKHIIKQLYDNQYFTFYRRALTVFHLSLNIS